MDAVYYHAVSFVVCSVHTELTCRVVGGAQPKNFEIRRVPIPTFGEDEVLFKGECFM